MNPLLAQPARGWSIAVAQPFHGWRVAWAGFGVLFIVYGLQFSYGTFEGAISADTGWSPTWLQLAYALYILAYSAVSVWSGQLTDRVGPRRVIATGAVLLAAGYLVLSAAPHLAVVFIGLAVIAPLGMSSSWVPANATVVRWFTQRRGLATGIVGAGGSAGGIVAPPIAAWLVSQFGWRTAVAVMAVVGGVFMAATALLFVRDPESVGQRPDGRPDDPAPDWPGSPIDTEDPASAWTAAQAWRTPVFWLIFGMFALTFVVVFVPFAHGVQYARSLGFSLGWSAGVISSIGVGGLVGRIVTGPLSDRIDRRRAVMLALAVETLSFAGIASADGLPLLYASAVAFGLSYGGSVAVFPALVADYFGRTHAGAIVGRFFATAGSFAAVGPYAAQLLLDATGGYGWTFSFAAVANACALGLAFTLPRPGLLAERTTARQAG
ncbi:MFS transporter [Candidatus Poriferisodalis sp.]|uniref:MFS transporter n=1 Tax=Candidatus Poriferisodalis sp. TaxID=3101277 RepID=UPI003B011F4B